jgi:hypothetical protein
MRDKLRGWCTRLLQWVRYCERFKRFAGPGNAVCGWIGGGVAFEEPHCQQVRHERDVGHGRLIAMAEPTRFGGMRQELLNGIEARM